MSRYTKYDKMKDHFMRQNIPIIGKEIFQDSNGSIVTFKFHEQICSMARFTYSAL